MKLLWSPTLYQVIPLHYRYKGKDTDIVAHQNGAAGSGTCLSKLFYETGLTLIQHRCFIARQYDICTVW